MTNNENKNQAIPVDLDALEALLEKATPGEWTASSHDWFALRTDALIICDRPPIFYSKSHSAWPVNSGAIAALHNAAPVLIGELRAARVEIAQIKSMRLCRQCAMAASFMAGGDGDGSVA